MLGGRCLPPVRRFAPRVCLSMAKPPGLVLSSAGPLVLVQPLELELSSHFQRRLCVFILNHNFSGKKKKSVLPFVSRRVGKFQLEENVFLSGFEKKV